MMSSTGAIKSPPMGWNSYDYYDTTVNEEQVKANAGYMARNLKAYGWEYVVVDIAWYSKEAGQKRDKYQYVPFARVEMDEYSRLMPDTDRFPSAAGGRGFGPLAEYVHSLGLKFGIHIMRGIPRAAAYQRTKIKGCDLTANEVADPYSICAWNPDMYGVDLNSKGAAAYYDSIVKLYAGWGVDFIKCDDVCRMDAPSSKGEIRLLHEAIEKCGRDIVLSLSPGPALIGEQEFYHENAEMWRMTDDFWDSWESLKDMFDRCREWQPYVREGGYPDCDMLPLGLLGKGFGEERRTNFTTDEQKTMLTLWIIFRSPLMIGAELTKLDPETLALLTNKDVYAMAKDIVSSAEVYRDTSVIIWEADGRDYRYRAVFNISDESIETAELDVDLDTGLGENGLELWTGERIAEGDMVMRDMEIAPHGVMLLRMERQKD